MMPEITSSNRMIAQPAPVIDSKLMRKFDFAGPRYTSYPTADRFVEAFDESQYRCQLRQRAVGGLMRPLSLYVHVPFCQSVCFYCGCNKVATKDRNRADKYLKYLSKEAALVSQELNGDRHLKQLHLGGGTPTFLTPAQLETLMEIVNRYFRLDPDGEYSIEIDPRSVARGTVALLAQLGFNRLSIGVQDFDPTVQRAVNRIQSEEETRAVVDEARAAGFRSINVDLIYGLPKQNVIEFNRTLERIIDISPDRIALYSYAHLPHMFKPQRRIAEEDLPSPEDKLRMLGLGIRRFAGAGYVYIGMDHFAKPTDELAVAQRQGRLHRNFQGYSTRSECDLVSLGITAIGNVGASYVQNVRTLDEYYYSLDQEALPVLRGLELSADDLLRRAVIQSLMCHGNLSIESIEIAHLIKFSEYFRDELADLTPFLRDGLLEIDDEWITITPAGRLFLRPICMVFDRYLRLQRRAASYSKVI